MRRVLIFFTLSILFFVSVTLKGQTFSFILVCHESTTEESCKNYFKQNSDAISFAQYWKSMYGTITKDFIYKFTLFHQEPFDSDSIKSSKNSLSYLDFINKASEENFYSLVEELTNGFLSPIKKSLLLSILKTEGSLNTPQESISDEINPWNNPLQSKTLREGAEKYPGILYSPIELHRKDDELYINGFLVKHEHLKTIQFHPNLYYHIAYISNTYQPFVQWGLGKEIKPIPKIKIITGTCQKTSWENNSFETPDSIKVLFNSSCINTVSKQKIHPSTSFFNPHLDFSDFSKKPSYSEPSQSQWMNHPVITIATSFIVFNLLHREFQKNSSK